MTARNRAYLFHKTLAGRTIPHRELVDAIEGLIKEVIEDCAQVTDRRAAEQAALMNDCPEYSDRMIKLAGDVAACKRLGKAIRELAGPHLSPKENQNPPA